MSFAHPFVLLLLAAPVLLAMWEWQRRGHPLVLPFDHGQPRRGHVLQRIVMVFNLLPALLLGAAVLLLAGPQKQAFSDKQRVLNNILICLDVSGSMTAKFGEGTRSDAAMDAINKFTSHRKGDAFGLTIFGSDVLHWVPVTKDLSAIKHSAPFLRPERMPRYMWGTLIAKALRACQKVLVTQEEGDRMVILISDGESYDLYGGAAPELGTALRSDRIVVYYIHVAEGSPQDEMVSIAGMTGGAAFAANDPGALHEVFKRIDAMAPTKLKPSEPEFTDWFKPVALVGLVLLGLQVAGGFGLRYTPW